jgi:hypothetical protein
VEGSDRDVKVLSRNFCRRAEEKYEKPQDLLSRDSFETGNHLILARLF